jgi:16S rRNA (cytidine1402-2'-O)-methyltransferase
VRVLDLAMGVAEVLELVAGGIRLKEAAADVSAASGLGKRELYEHALQAKTGAPAVKPDRSAFPLG